MNTFSKALISGFVSLVVLVGGIFAGERMAWKHQPAPQAPLAGSFTPVMGTQFTVGSTVLPSDSTVTLSSFNTPDGRQLSMTYFGYKGYGTLDPTNTSRIESISFTGITPNGNGTVTLTGVLRGLDFVAPYAASSTLQKTHLVGAQFILANTSAFYGNEFLFTNQIGTSSAILTFSSTTPPRLDEPAAQSTGTYIATTSEFATIAYVLNTTLSGAANATNVVKGLVQLTTSRNEASSTNLGSTGASNVLSAQFATDTPSTLCSTSVSCTVKALISGKISQSWLDLTQAFSWSGLNTFSSGIVSTASSTFNTGALHIGNVVATAKFGGTGSDGILDTTSGNVNINLGNAEVVTKNYTSINIATNNVTFTNPNTNGSLIILKSQGNCTITSNIYATSTGAAAGSNALGNIGSALGGGGGSTGGGAVAAPLSNPFAPSIAGKLVPLIPGAGGGTGGNGTNGGATGGAGAAGGGALYIECGGALNFTGTISVNGLAGAVGLTSTASGGGGGGGGGGTVGIVYTTLTSNAGSIVTTGGAGGSAGGGCTSNSGGSGGAGGAGASANGGAGGASSGCAGGNGGTGGAGASYVVPNTEF